MPIEKNGPVSIRQAERRPTAVRSEKPRPASSSNSRTGDRYEPSSRTERERDNGSDRRLENLARERARSSNSSTAETPTPPSNGSTFDTYFDVYDNPGGGDTDGRVSSEDVEAIASGDYDREAAEERLRDQGVDSGEIDETLDRIESTARHYHENADEFARIDGIDTEGDTDNRITRDDVTSALAAERSEARDDINLTDDEALESFERDFGILDNPGGGDTDGQISRDDLEEIASGDYDRQAARERLRDQGLSETELDARLARTEATAQHILADESLYSDLDGANDDGHTDGDIRRGDLDRLMLDRREAPEPVRASAAERQEAQEIYQGWGSPADITRRLAEQPDLNEYSQAELLALAQAGADNPEIASRLQDHVIDTVNASDSLNDLPEGEGFQHLLAPVLAADAETDEAAANAQEHLRGLVDGQLGHSLDNRLRDRRGDSEADLGLERFGADVEDLAARHPALAGLIGPQAEALLGDSEGRITDVRQNDDGLLRNVVHDVTGGVRNATGFVADRIRDVGHYYGRFQTLGGRILGEAADWAVTSAGQVAGAGLDAVGADGVADGVRDVTRSAGNGINAASDWASRQTENFYDGLYGSAAGLVEGAGHIVTDPVGTVTGLASVAQDPTLLLEPFRQTVRENGYAGLAGSLTFDVVTGVLTGGASPAARGLTLSQRAAAAGRLLIPTDAAGAAQTVAANGEYLANLEGPQLTLNPLLLPG